MKTHKLRRGVKYLVGALIILYPVLVFSALVIFKINIRYLSILLIALAAAYVVINKHNYRGRHPAFVFISPSILFTIGAMCFILPFFIESGKLYEIILKVYPALADMVYLTVMGTSLFIPPNLVFNFVNLFDKNLKEHIDPGYLDRYCRKSALIWCAYFIVDAAISLFTTFKCSAFVWAVYNSGITYVIMGLILAGEYVFIKVIENYIVNVIKKNGLSQSQEEKNEQ